MDQMCEMVLCVKLVHTNPIIPQPVNSLFYQISNKNFPASAFNMDFQNFLVKVFL